jgi:hypothetical protein
MLDSRWKTREAGFSSTFRLAVESLNDNGAPGRSRGSPRKIVLILAAIDLGQEPVLK